MTLSADDDLRDQISRIEDDIEGLTKTLGGCRKTMLLSKVVIAAGGIWILAYLIGAIRLNATAMTGAIAAVLRGIVVFGSNSSTSKQTATAMEAAERRRAELIGTINLRVVGGGDLEGIGANVRSGECL